MFPSTKEKNSKPFSTSPNYYKYLNLDPEVDVVMKEEIRSKNPSRQCLFCGRFGNLHVYHGREAEVWFCKTALQLIGLDEATANSFFQVDLFMCLTCYKLAAVAVHDYVALEKKQIKFRQFQQNMCNRLNASSSLQCPGISDRLHVPVAALKVPNFDRISQARGEQNQAADEAKPLAMISDTADDNRIQCPECGKYFAHNEAFCQHLMRILNRDETSPSSATQ